MMAAERNPLLDHVWGLSPAADRVWAQICGIAPSTKPWERLFVVLEGYLDESYKDHGFYVIGGYIATADEWAKFSQEWELLLPLTFRNKLTGRHRFKFREMNRRLKDVQPFYRVIENHVICSLYCAINLTDLERAKARISPPFPIKWGKLAGNSFRLTFRCLLDSLHYERSSFGSKTAVLATFLPGGRKIDLYLDDHSSKGIIIDTWNNYIMHRPKEMKELYGRTPRFESDEDFLPLQAADFWAGWVRKAYESIEREKLDTGDFGYWQRERIIPRIHIYLNEEKILEALVILVKDNLKAGEVLYVDGKPL